MHAAPAPDHRWRRVSELADGCRRLGREDDTWVRAGLSYLRCLRRLAEGGRRCAICPHAGVAEAHDLFEGDDFRRAVLEARILADQPAEDIATRCGVTSDAVHAYETLYFDVRTRLSAKCFIMLNVIGYLAGRPVSDGDMGTVAKLVAYARGHRFLDVILESLRQPVRVPNQLDGLSAAELRVLTKRLGVHNLVSAYTTPASRLRSVTTADELTREVEAYAKAVGASPVTDAWKPNLASLFDPFRGAWTSPPTAPPDGTSS